MMLNRYFLSSTKLHLVFVFVFNTHPSSYSGDYGDAMNLEFLKSFHRRRVQVLAESGADLIAFETVPNKLEAQVTAKSLPPLDLIVYHFSKLPWPKASQS